MPNGNGDLFVICKDEIASPFIREALNVNSHIMFHVSQMGK